MTMRGDDERTAWEIHFESYDPEDEKRRESLFSLGNGVVLVRGCASDAERSDSHYPGTYRAGCYNELTGEIEGELVRGRTLVNLPNWLPLTFRIGGEADWFDLDRTEMLSYNHRLDMKRGLTFREVLVRDPAGRETFLAEERLVSMASPELAAFVFRIEPRNWSGEVTIRSGINGSVVNSNVPLHGEPENRHLVSVTTRPLNSNGLLVEACTSQSEVRIAIATRTRFDGMALAERRIEQQDGVIAEERKGQIETGGFLVVEKTAAICAVLDGDAGDPCQDAQTFLEQAPEFSELREAHVAAWAGLWRSFSFDAGDPDYAQKIRFHMFHVLQTISPLRSDVDVGFPGRGWQEGYHGHVFWDEAFVFPFFSLNYPEGARTLLLHRFRRLDAARRSAREAGLAGAMFPWRSATTGEEETPEFQKNPLSGRWMRDHTHHQVHISASIAYGLWRYVSASGDTDFLHRYGAEMLIEIARLFASVSCFDDALGRYRIRGVVGPDEFHTSYPEAHEPGIDDNAYTNIMAVWTLERALRMWEGLEMRHRSHLTSKLDLDPAELERWHDITRRMRVPFHGNGIISQFEGFEDLLELDRATLQKERPDWVLEARGDDVNRYQVLKQTDVLMLYHLLGEHQLIAMLHRLGYEADEEQLRRTADYYLQRTSHDSSMSRVAVAGALASLDPQMSWKQFTVSLHSELDPAEEGGSSEGVQLGAMAGTIDVLVRRYFGVNVTSESISIDSAVPIELPPTRFVVRCRFGAFTFRWDDGHLSVTAEADNKKAAPLRINGSLWMFSAGDTAVVAPRVGRKS